MSHTAALMPVYSIVYEMWL